MSVQTFSLKINGEQPVSKNFKVKEFKSKCGADEILIDVAFVQNFLQKIRDHFNKPVIIHSGYRSLAHNRAVKSKDTSFHPKGRAFDIRIEGVKTIEIAQYAERIGIKGIIWYDTGFVHIDSRNGISQGERKWWAKDIKGQPIEVKTFA